MKNVFSLLAACLLMQVSLAQNEFINYKATIKDSAGNIVANQSIGVKIEILKGSVPVYTETHTPTTDANGLIILDIGNGTSTDEFSSLIWDRFDGNLSAGGDPEFVTNSLIVGIDLAGGTSYTDMGTTEFKSVPYAHNVINGGLYRKGEGWKLEHDFSLDGETIQDPGIWGIDMTEHKDGPINSSSGAWGNWSFAAGRNNLASGHKSVALGSDNQSTGYGSVAFGEQNHSGGQFSMAHGDFNNVEGVSGDYSIAFGHRIKAEAFHSFSFGRFNIGGGDALNWVATDPIFEIGNGTSGGSRSNAITILKNGNTGIGTSSPGNPLSVLDATTQNSVRFESQLQLAGKDLLELVIPSGSGGSSQFIEMQQGVTIVAAINGDGSAEFSSVTTDSGTFRNVNVANRISNDSDIRLKRDIEDLKYGLDEILQLNPKAYYWKDNKINGSHKSLGLIAQELKMVIQNVVHEKNDDARTLSVNYIELIPVLVNAIKEQQQQIELLRADNTTKARSILELTTLVQKNSDLLKELMASLGSKEVSSDNDTK